MKIFKIIFLLSFFVFCIVSAEAKTINFAVISDTHYTINNENNTFRDLTLSGKVLKGAVDRINENKYDFVVFLGDNIDKSNERSLRGFLRIVSGIKGTPYYIVLGNHDAHKISGLAKQEYLEIVSEYNKNQRKAQASYCFSPSKDILAIVLDGSSSGMPSSHGIFTPKTLQWLDDVLTKNKNKKVIIFQHFPYMEPFLNPSHEILDKMEYKAVINRHENILMIVSGHYHKEGVFKDERSVYHISAPALYMSPYYYDEIKVEYDKTLFEKAKNFKLDGTPKPAI